MSWLQYGIISLAITTAVIHLLAGLNEFILLLNGLGYLALLAALYLMPASPIKNFRVPLYWGLIGYTVVTIMLYFASHPWGFDGNSLDRLGLATKAIEVILVSLVLIDWRQHRQGSNLAPRTSAQLSEL